MVVLLLALCAWLPATPQTASTQGTTVPVNRELAARLADAESFLAEGRIQDGLALLQETAETDPALLLPATEINHFRGGAAAAVTRLAQLPPAWQAQRERMFGARATEQLLEALDPPDLPRLEELARIYAGLEAGARARLAAAELWLDRGQVERARLLDPEGRLPDWTAPGLLPPEPEAAQRLPAVRDLRDPRLPLLDTSVLQPLWSREFEGRASSDVLVRHRLAIGGGIVYASDGYEVLALEAGSGRELWRYEADPRWGRMEGSERLRDAISQHYLTAPVLAEGILLAVVHEAEPLGRLDSYMKIPIRRLMPARRLVALDARDGRLLWKMHTGWDEGRSVPRDLAAGPPAVAAGRVFLPVYDAVGTIDCSMLALELRTGRILWRRYLASGQLETNLFGNVLVELATPPPLADAERVLACSHLGSFHALDAATGATLWTRLYPRMELRPTETGRVAIRPQLLGRNLGVSDGARAAWAPVDAESIFLLDAADGRLLAEWPALDAEDRHLFTLLGMQSDGVWASGSRVALLRPAGSGPADHSDPIYEEGGRLNTSRLGAMIQGEILLPVLYEGVARFTGDPPSFGGAVLHFAGGRLDAGAVQAAPGLLFVERPDGFAAFGSLRSITAAFRNPQLDLATLAEVLPVALNLDFSASLDNARQLAESAAALAARPDFAPEAARLRLLAARGWLQAGDLNRAEPLLLNLLQGPDPALAESACGLLLDDPFLLDPLRPGVASAIAAAEAWPGRTLPLHDGRSAAGAAVTGRARALRALAGDRSLTARRCLTDLLLLPSAGHLTVDGRPLQDWAAAALDMLLRSAVERAGYEEDGRERLARSACSAEFLRAFGDTAAAQEALAREVAREDLPRAQRVIRARWRREHGAPDRVWPDLARWLPPPAPPPEAPRQLVPGGSRKAYHGPPLHVRAGAKGEALAWVPARSALQLCSFEPGRANELQAYPITGRRLSGNETVVATAEGCALVVRDRILHFGLDGRLTELPLPAELADNAQPLALGEGLVAAVLQSRPGFLRLAVFDASSGEVYLEEELPGQPGRRIELRHADTWLYLLEENAAIGYRVDLRFQSPPLAFALATPMNGVDLPTATLAGGAVHYLLYRNNPAMSWLVRAGPGAAPLQLPFEGQFVRRVRVAPGLAFTLQPPNRGAEPEARVIHWMMPGTERPRAIRLDHPEARILQQVDSEYKRHTDPPPTQALVLSPEPDGSTRVQAFGPTAEAAAWSCVLPDVAFRDLQSNQPNPRQARDAWVLPLLLRASAAANPRLEILLIEPNGSVRARASADWAGTGVDQVRVDLLPGALLVRNGDTLTLYGDPR